MHIYIYAYIHIYIRCRLENLHATSRLVASRRVTSPHLTFTSPHLHLTSPRLASPHIRLDLHVCKTIATREFREPDLICVRARQL